MDTAATIKVADFVPVLDQITGFMQEALAAHESDTTKIAQLTQKLADQDKVILQKVATPVAQPTQVFSDAAIKETMDSLQAMNIIDQELATKYASDIKEDPRKILPLLTKISEALIATPPGEGFGIEKASASESEDSDPDGWSAFAKGQPVKIKN